MSDLEEQISKDLEIDDTNIDGELKRQPGRFFYWASLKAKAAQRVRQERASLDTMRAETGKKFKEAMAVEDPKLRVTERLLDDYLDINEDVAKRKASLISAQFNEDILDVAVDAFRQKHYALVEISKSKETERIAQNEFNLMKKDFEAREAKKRREA